MAARTRSASPAATARWPSLRQPRWHTGFLSSASPPAPATTSRSTRRRSPRPGRLARCVHATASSVGSTWRRSTAASSSTTSRSGSTATRSGSRPTATPRSARCWRRPRRCSGRVAAAADLQLVDDRGRAASQPRRRARVEQPLFARSAPCGRHRPTLDSGRLGIVVLDNRTPAGPRAERGPRRVFGVERSGIGARRHRRRGGRVRPAARVRDRSATRSASGSRPIIPASRRRNT